MTPPRPRRLIGIGFRQWKRYNLAPLLRTQADRLIFVRNAAAARRLHPTAQDALLWWSATPPAGTLDLAAESQAPTIRLEDGFYRSVGLGSDFIPPLSLVLDRSGIYFDPSAPSDLETLLQTADFTAEELEQARQARAFILENRLTKYNLEPSARAQWPAQGRAIIFVPGQVETDASIRLGCADVRTNLALLEAARRSAPDAFIVFKPHPDVASGNRRGRVALQQLRRFADHVETDLSVVSCIDACDEVHTMTSQAGFEALLRGKAVTTYGQPFYAGWGVTRDRNAGGAALARRTRRLTLDELTAGALIRYPLYWDAREGRPTTPMAVLRHLAAHRNALERAGQLERLRSGFWRRWHRKLAVLTRAALPRARH